MMLNIRVEIDEFQRMAVLEESSLFEECNHAILGTMKMSLATPVDMQSRIFCHC